MARSNTVLGQFDERIFPDFVLVVPQVSGCKNWNRTGSLTRMRVRITIADSNTALTGVVLTVSSKAVRVFIPAFSPAVVVV